MNNQDAHDAITSEFTRYKAEKTSRADRMAFSERLSEQYFAEHGKWPNGSVLDRLSTLILQDEIADATPWKSQRNEYHIQSPREELDYYKGLTARSIPETIAADGTDKRIPTRRKRLPSENASIDRQAGRKRRNDYKR